MTKCFATLSPMANVVASLPKTSCLLILLHLWWLLLLMALLLLGSEMHNWSLVFLMLPLFGRWWMRLWIQSCWTG